MKKVLLLFLFTALSFQVVVCQTETFEDETDNTTTFTEMTTGATFNVTSNFEVQIGGPFGAGGSNGWLDSQAGNPVTGIVGEIQVTGITTSFKLTQLEAWTSADNASNQASGTVTFRGTPVGGGGPLVETFFVDPPNISTYDVVTFTGDLNGAEITALEVDLTASGLNYIGIDNIVFSEVTLPVELLSFKVMQNNLGQVFLNWTTASELNSDKFEIEESQNGREFQKIGEVNGNGTALELKDYNFEIENPRNGISYYRLKQIDFDGQFEFSEVISVTFKGKSRQIGEFYPNPSKAGIVNLDYNSQNDNEITISVFDVSGKLVTNQIQQISEGSNNLSLDFSSLNTGTYIVKIGDEINPTYRKLTLER